MGEDEIDSKSFIEARAAEIKYLEGKIKKSTKKSCLFQRQPFYKRRRLHSKTKISKNLNKRRKKKQDHPYLRTHVWFAKRFEMVRLFGTFMPFKRRQKSDKFIYKSSKRGYIIDESYKSIRFYERLVKDKSIINDNAYLTIKSVNSETVEEDKKIILDENVHMRKVCMDSSNGEKNMINKINSRLNNELVEYSKIDADILGKITESETNSEISNIREQEAIKTHELQEDENKTNEAESAPNYFFLEENFLLNHNISAVFDTSKCKKFDETKFQTNTCTTILIHYKNNFVLSDVILTKSYLITISLDSPLIDSFFEAYNLEFCSDSCISLIFGTEILNESGVYRGKTRQTDDIDAYIAEKFKKKEKDNETEFLSPFCFIKSSSDMENGKILVNRKNIMNIWQFFCNNGVIPISILEHLRLGLEYKKMIFPYDFPNTCFFNDFEKSCYKHVEEKYLRTPASKKPNYEKLGVENPFYLPESVNKNFIDVSYFEADTGSLERMAVIKNNDNELVGYVLRGAFCFSIGKCRGVCVLFKKSTGDLYAKNLIATKTHKIVLK
ncbi:hypothetical protein EDEG_03521 [Edhazardia aedis USNM 41457]|uniref:Pop1 N-terminal domain-containing protein n=1 Tax=Edhazardia aedis (strain USNM 41457) TaxID=1003232 RepID=J9D380_EDHAE|nr:hypothetical protein EDEG_03521 [Edhazardia aedis USNM 41457]|eukprot:EJW02024.1 hypothetical protein EDEG_03521 [Edhazardia aedis USNM 41457]